MARAPYRLWPRLRGLKESLQGRRRRVARAAGKRGGPWILAATLLLCLSGLMSCNAMGRNSPAPAGVVDSEGYSLLYKLVSKQKDVDKLLLLKSEAQDVNTLIQRIAAACANGATKLEEFAKAESSLNLNLESLPAAEIATRKAIESEKARALLLSGGKEFEVRLLLSQIQGMNYGSKLAATLAKGEKHPARKSYMEYLSEELGKLEHELLALIQSRFRDLER